MAGLFDLKVKLGVDNIEEEKKSKLFKDFKKAGGDVVEVEESEEEWTKKKLKSLIEQKKEEERKLREQEELLEKVRLENLRREQEQNKTKSTSEGTPVIVGSRPKLEYFIEMLSALFSTWLGGVLTIFTNRISKKFLKLSGENFKEHMIASYKILMPIFLQNNDTSRLIRMKLRKLEKPYYFEYLYRFLLLYEQSFFTLIDDLISKKKYPEETVPIFIKLYKRIYLLLQYQQALQDSITYVLSCDMEVRRTTRTSVENHTILLKKAIEFVISEYYEKLNLLIDYYFKLRTWKNYNLAGSAINFIDFLSFTEEDKIGFYTRKWEIEDDEEEQKRKKEEEKKLKEEEEKQRAILLSQVEKGLDFIKKNFSPRELLSQTHKRKDLNPIWEINEKAFVLLSLFRFFEKEFSFLFSSNRYEFDWIQKEDGKAFDVKKIISDQFARIQNLNQKEHDYTRLSIMINNLTGFKSSKTITSNPEVQHALSQQEGIYRLMLENARLIIEEIMRFLGYFATDPEKMKEVIKHPNATISPETEFAPKRIVHGKTLGESIELCYAVTCALYFLVKEGDLSGYGLFIKEPKQLGELLA